MVIFMCVFLLFSSTLRMATTPTSLARASIGDSLELLRTVSFIWWAVIWLSFTWSHLVFTSLPISWPWLWLSALWICASSAQLWTWPSRCESRKKWTVQPHTRELLRAVVTSPDTVSTNSKIQTSHQTVRAVSLQVGLACSESLTLLFQTRM